MKQTFTLKSFALFSALIFFSVKTEVFAQTCPGNLLTNPGFEDGLNNWSNWGGLTLSADAHSGTKAVYVADGLSSGGANAAPATPGNNYTLSAFAKISADVNWGSIEIIFYDANWVQIECHSKEVTTLSYQQHSLTAVAPHNAAWVSATLWKQTDGELWVDDYCLTSGGPSSSLTLGNRVFYDNNGNGVFDDGDWGLDGYVTVKLYADNNNDGVADGAALGTTTAADGGFYNFTGLSAGNYLVQLEETPDWLYLTPRNGGDPDNNIENDNNGLSHDIAAKVIKGGTITLTQGGEPGGISYNSSYDIAVFKYNGLGDNVWFDNNGNGTQDSGELGVPGATVKLINPVTNAVLETTTTDGTGYYFFADPSGKYGITTYTIEFVSPAGFKPTSSNKGSDDEKDSDAVGGRIENVTVPNGKWDYSLDAGFVPNDYWLLPLKMLSFNATLENNKKVQLKWLTENETNLNHFEVERSTDGVNFQEIGMVFSQQSADGKGSYTYPDDISSITGSVIYYRLRSVDVDGKVSVSEVRVIKLTKHAANNINIAAYPNPAVNEIRVTVPSQWQNKPVTYEVISMNGQVVKKFISKTAGQTEAINLISLQSGTYIVKVGCEGEVATQKFVKQ